MIPDFPGYGASGGTPTERSLYATADAAYARPCSPGRTSTRRS